MFVLLSAVWAVANPIAAAPDEPSHIVKAAGIVRGQTLGELVDGNRLLELPRIYGYTHQLYGCHAFRPEISAACSPVDFADAATPTPTYTSAANYNPLYYAVVGLPTVLPPSLNVLYLMRLASAVLCGGLLALGIRSVAETAPRRWTVAGTAVALVPMVFFMNSTVNPNAMEAAAGVGLWLTLLVALRRPDPGLLARRWWRAGVLVVALANGKALAPVLLAMLVLTVVGLVGWAPVREVLRDRRAWPGLALGTVGTAVAGIWSLTQEPVSGLDEVAYPQLENRWTAAEYVLRSWTQYYEQTVANFGWHDSQPPHWVYAWVSVALGLLLLLALVAGRRRERVVLVVACAAVVLAPLAFQLPFAPQVGLPWQGRYLAAFALGVPIMAGVVLDGAAGRTDLAALGRPLTRLVVVMMAVVQVVSFGANLRRYVAGAKAPWFEPVATAWHPPLPVWMLLAGAAVAVALVAGQLAWLLRERQPDAGAGRDVEGVAAVSPSVSGTSAWRRTGAR